MLSAARCTLEPQLALHASEMFAVLSDPAIYEFENAPPPSEAWLHDRFTKLESRRSKDGSAHWLNWVVRLPGSELAGYVQATVEAGIATIAYEFASRFWRQGLGSCAVDTMMNELVQAYGAQSCIAVLKAANYRSLALLNRLGFSLATARVRSRAGAEADEVVMSRDF
jgi:[ribosomal protein S5]-alanine N-acetyltransferase